VSPQGEVTRLLVRLQAVPADQGARACLLELVESDLRQLARSLLAREDNRNPLLQSTYVLVNEVYVKLIGNTKCQIGSTSAEFRRIAARAMRNILVDYARHQRCQPRQTWQTDIDHLAQTPDRRTISPDRLTLVVHEAIERLEELAEKKRAAGDEEEARRDALTAELLQLRVFGSRPDETSEATAAWDFGSMKDVSEVLGVSPATAYRLWLRARAVLDEVWAEHTVG
jgi:hypothetical protein